MAQKILIVEDDLISAEFLKLFLESEAYIVAVAGSLGEAQQVLEDFTPDIVITDLLLGADNGSVVARICKERGAQRVVGVSGLDSGRLSEMKIDVSVFDKLLVKPIEFDNLLSALKSS